MNIELAKKYAELTSSIKEVESEYKKKIEELKKSSDYDDIKNQVLEEMCAEKQKTIPTEYGNVTVRETKSYEYPDAWEQETKEYKLRKKSVEKNLLEDGRYSINVSLQLAGKPKKMETKESNPKGTLH